MARPTRFELVTSAFGEQTTAAISFRLIVVFEAYLFAAIRSRSLKSGDFLRVNLRVRRAVNC